jgi:bifunctional non-homologous end joining protein LigD
MSLTQYHSKRHSKSPEPKGGKPDKKSLRFVVQKHDATNLHYDFRLEMDGVLKSWAVPKGPSMDPAQKRLAVMVEDHPYDYRTFEGVIPEGHYGAGTVMVWDEGTYHAAEGEFKGKQSEDKELSRQLKAGKVKFILEGHKLKGAFAIVKSFGKGGKNWLLMKLMDRHASTVDVLKKERSVISGRTLAGITKEK